MSGYVLVLIFWFGSAHPSYVLDPDGEKLAAHFKDKAACEVTAEKFRSLIHDSYAECFAVTEAGEL